MISPDTIGIPMNQKNRIAVFNLLLFFTLLYFLFCILIALDIESDYMEIGGIALIAIVSLLFYYIFSTVKMFLQKDFLPLETLSSLRDKDILLFIFLNVYLSFFVKNFDYAQGMKYYGFIKVTIFVNYILIFFIGLFLINIVLNEYSLDKNGVILEIKRWYVGTGFLCPFLIMIFLTFSFGNLPFKINFNFNIVFLLIISLLVFGFVLFLYLSDSFISIVLFKSFTNSRNKDFVKSIVENQITFEKYLNSKIRLATVANIFSSLIVLLVYLFAILF